MHEGQSLAYALPNASWRLEIGPTALALLAAWRQTGFWSKESVGQLYSADLSGPVVKVAVVTRTAARWAARAGVQLDLQAARRERSEQFAKGLHCLGLWHSHPQDVPEPSPVDRVLANDHAKAGQPAFAGMVFAIIGRAEFPAGLGIWIADGKELWPATHVISLAKRPSGQ